MLRRVTLLIVGLGIALFALRASASPLRAQTASVGVSIQPSSRTIMPNASTTVALMATAPTAGLGAWTVNVQYDPTVLQVAACTSTVGSLCNTAFATNLIRVTGATLPGLTGSQTLATIGFTGIGAPNSSSTLTPTIVTFADSNDSPIANPVALSGAIIIDPPASAATSTVSANPTSVLADGSTATTITVVTNDSSGAPVAGKTISLGQALPAGGTAHATIQAVSATTNSQGAATFTATDSTVENVVFTATDTADAVQISQTASVNFVVGPVSPTSSTVSAAPGSVPADGSSTATLTVTLFDTAGHAVSGKSVSLAQATGHSAITTLTGTTTASGQASFSVKDATAESVTYTATDTSDGITLTATAQVQFTAVASAANAANSTIGASPASVPADGTTAATVTVTLKDANNNPTGGKAVTLSALSGHSTIAPTTATTNASGQASFSVTDNAAELVSYSAKDTTDSVTLTHTAPVQFVQLCASCAISIQPSSITVSPNDVVALTLQAVDPATGLGAWQVNVAYDPTVLQVVSCTPNTSAGSQLCNPTFHSNAVELNGASSGLSGSQTLATLTFQAIGAVGASSALTVSVPTFADATGVPTAVTPGNGLVSLSLVGGQGDVNLDGVVNAVDALCVLRLVAHLPATNVCPQTAATQAAADVNRDRTVNSLDALCVLRIASHLPATSSCPLFSSGVSSAASRSDAATRASGAAAVPVLDSTQVKLSAATVSARQNQRTTVTLTSAVAAGLGAWTVDVAYNPQSVRVVSCQALDGSVCNASYEAGTLRVSGAAASGLSAGQQFAQITFEGIERTHAVSSIAATPTLLTDVDGNPLAAK